MDHSASLALSYYYLLNNDEFNLLKDTSILFVDTSKIRNAGKGLFTKAFIPKGSIICLYIGHVIESSKSAFHLKDKSYLMRLDKDKYINCSDILDIHARYINDPRNSKQYNAKFVKVPFLCWAEVHAIRDINDREEIYLDYGVRYWLGYNSIYRNHTVKKIK